MTTPRKHTDVVRPARPQRPRLVPPQLGDVERSTRTDRDAERFSRGLRGQRRRRLLTIAGNLLIFGLLVGVPVWRGYARAVAAQAAYRSFAGCVTASKVAGGLADPVGEAERVAQRLAQPGRAWVAGCRAQLAHVAPEPAHFVSPPVKEAEARVREAVAMLDVELAALAGHVPGAPMPDRPLRALRLLRGTLRKLVDAAGFTDREAELPSRLEGPLGLPAPARLPLFAAADATLTVWGDDMVLRVVALDGSGVAYLEAEPGKPFTRARAARSRSLRAFLKGDEQDLLVWGTPAARCAERADGCAGKTTRLAAVRGPLLQLPDARTLALHLAGRPDRSLAVTEDGLLAASLGSDRRAQVRRVALGSEFAVGAELPALLPSPAAAPSAHEVLVLSAQGDAVALGLERGADPLRIVQLAPVQQELGTLPRADGSWITGCADEQRVGFAAASGGQLQLGALRRVGGRFELTRWPALPLSVPHAIHDEQPGRDRVRSLCLPNATALVARVADDQLVAVVCGAADAPCRTLPVASQVEHFSLLPTARGALIAYSGGTLPQVRLRSLDLKRGALDQEHIPAACWVRGGLCGRPTLARLGQRIILVAPDKTDLLALESADEGRTWGAPPVL